MSALTTEDLLNRAQINWGLAAAELYLYGIYSVMFGFYLYVLRTRHIARKHRFLNIATISLFIFGTAHCAFELARTILSTEVLGFPARSPKAAQVSLIASSAMYATSNLIADIVFIFRCYSIWNRRLTIILLPAFLLTRLGFGYTSVALLVHFFSEKTPTAADIHLNTVGTDLFIASLSISLFTTVLLMGLTVGRIWVLARSARLFMGREAVVTYYMACAMILESGALYCFFGIAFVVVGFKVVIDGFATGGVFAQIVCIAPTLIAVRVGLGSSVEDVNSFARIPRAAQPPFVATPQAGTHELSEVYFIHTIDNKEPAI
ncbi:hypothetical protein B0H16DRAFT_1723563 [Mycena metata]|uniref:Uncharacterized protein n=1 Tax=Mycena metata TaxID=1033252 RepID=A0AAD7J1R7_9AGAR|nr:hypothetical protein B0H16DRAFT_1723563 [Mycena metata]